MNKAFLFSLGFVSAVSLTLSGAANGQTSVNRQVAGTSDSGGGPGFDGRVLEASSVNPLELPAYKAYVSAWWKRIAFKEEAFKLEQAALTKTWFIAPIDFENVLTKKAVGVTFVKNALQPPALQTGDAVWIRKAAFDQSTLLDQAKLILHEQIELIYFSKFKTFNELCRISTSLRKAGEDCGSGTEEFSELLPPVPRRPLDQNDYANIEFVTSWLIHNDREVSQNEFYSLLLARGFDRRLFGFNIGDDKNIEVPGRIVLQAIRAYTMLDANEIMCIGQTTKITKPCRLTVVEAVGNFSGMQIPGVRLTISAAGEKPISFWTYLVEKNQLLGISEMDGSTSNSLIFEELAETNKFGDHRVGGFIHFHRLNGQLIMDSLSLRQARIVSIDRNRIPVCYLQTSKAKTFSSDAILLTKKKENPGLLPKMLLKVELTGGCTASNVVD